MFDVLLFFISSVLVFYYVNTKVRKKKEKYKTPPGPTRLPFVGYLSDLFKIKNGADLYRVATDHVLSYNYIGFSSAAYFGSICAVARPEHVKAILTSKAALHKPKFVYLRLKFVGDSLLAHPVELWQQRRKLIAPAFHQLSINRYFNKFSHVTQNRFCPMLDDKYADKDYFHVEDVVSYHTLLGFMETMLSIDTTNLDPVPVMKTLHAVDRMLEKLSGNILQHAIDVVHESFFGKTATSDDLELHSFISGLLDMYDEQKQSRGQGDDTLSTTMESLKTLPREEQIKELQIITIGAYGTGSISISYLSVLLAMHPHIQDKIYEEMKNIFGDSDRPATEEDVKNMVYLEACIKESMRLYPTAPFIVRQTTEDIQLDDEYTISAGTMVFVLSFLLHRNPSVWKNPDIFDPENFSPENSQNMNPYSYIPFSAGARNCIGYKFGMLMMKLTMSAMIRKYHLETDMNMSELKIDRLFSLRASHLRIRLRTRSR